MTGLTNHFQMLRARIENSLSTPFVILVSSARNGDGKTVCSQGLAESLSAAGHRVLFVDLDHETPSLTGLPQVRTLVGDGAQDAVARSIVTDAKSGIAMLSLSNAEVRATASRENVAESVARFRGQFDAVVVDASRLVESSIGVLFASACDAVILTAREGRSVTRDDRTSLDVLEREGAKFFGIVTVSKRAIAEFQERSFKPTVRAASPVSATRTVVDPALGSSLVH